MSLGTTVDDLLDRARRDATLASRGAVYTLDSSYTAGGTTLVFNETITHIGQGSILAVDYELFYVQSANNATKTATVIPGYLGTTPTNHATGAIVEVDARFPKAALLDYAEHEIRSWGKQLWRVVAGDLEVDRAGRVFDLGLLQGATQAVTFIERKAGNVVEATVSSSSHGIKIGDRVSVTVPSNSSFDGTFTVTNITSANLILHWSQTGAVENAPSGTLHRLGVSGEIYFLLDVRLKPVGTTTDFWNFSWTGDAWPHAYARLLRETSTAEFASGTAIQFLRGAMKGTTARVALAQPFALSTLTSSTDLVSTVGLKPNWLDIVELGVRARALSSSVIGRTDWRTGNMARNAEEVSAFDVMRATQQAQGARDMRFAEEAAELRAEWPYRSGW